MVEVYVDLIPAVTSLCSVTVAERHQSCPHPGFWRQLDPPGSWLHLDDPVTAVAGLACRARIWAPCQICSNYPPKNNV